MGRPWTNPTFRWNIPIHALIRKRLCPRSLISCSATTAQCRTTAAILDRLTRASSTARPCSATGRWISWEEFVRPSSDVSCDLCESSLLSQRLKLFFSRVQNHGAEFSSDFSRSLLFTRLALAAFPARIHKIHSPERECKLSLRWKTAESSEAKATAPKANATAKSFLILPSPDTRKSSPTLPTPDRSSF